MALKKHEGSGKHIKNSLGLNQGPKNQNRISDALQEKLDSVVKFNKTVGLNRLVKTIRNRRSFIFVKASIGYLWHDTISSLNRGNFKELLKLLIQTCPVKLS